MDLPLTNPKAKGGTMALWHSSLSPYLKVLPTTSSSFFSVLISVPGHLPALHTAVYLPTAGRDGDWLVSVVELEEHVRGYIAQFSGHLATFLRCDLNASSKNKNRAAILAAQYDSLPPSAQRVAHPVLDIPVQPSPPHRRTCPYPPLHQDAFPPPPYPNSHPPSRRLTTVSKSRRNAASFWQTNHLN